jgi:hypothetical protein
MNEGLSNNRNRHDTESTVLRFTNVFGTKIVDDIVLQPHTHSQCGSVPIDSPTFLLANSYETKRCVRAVR